MEKSEVSGADAPLRPKMSLPPDIPPEVVPFLQEMGYLEPDTLNPGEQVAPLVLESLQRETEVVIGSVDSKQPVVLIFGSYT